MLKGQIRRHSCLIKSFEYLPHAPVAEIGLLVDVEAVESRLKAGDFPRDRGRSILIRLIECDCSLTDVGGVRASLTGLTLRRHRASGSHH